MPSSRFASAALAVVGRKYDESWPSSRLASSPEPDPSTVLNLVRMLPGVSAAPAGPGAPWMPCAPWLPFGPVGPAGPAGPVGPAAPAPPAHVSFFSLFLQVVDGETIRSWPFFLPDFLTHASIVAAAVWAVGAH